MKRGFPTWCSLAVAAAVAVWLLNIPAVAHAQAKGGGGQASSGSSSSGGSSGASSSGGHASGGGASGGGHASGASGGGHASGGGGSHSSSGSGHVGGSSATARSDSGGGSRGAMHGGSPSNAGNSSRVGTAVPRGSATSAPNSDAMRGGTGAKTAPGPVPQYSRPRGNQPVIGTAVPRSTVPPPNYVVLPGYGYGYYPWGLVGGFGFYGSYYGFYDPWYSGGYSGGYGGWDPYSEYTSPQSPSTPDEGAIHLRVRPSNASVYVDGNYVGIVDDFDGTFQKLHMSSGTHRIEIRADGYETLTFDVHIEADRTVTYKGELKKIQ